MCIPVCASSSNVFLSLHLHLGVLVSLSQPFPLTVTDCRGLIKTLVCGMKTIMWGVSACKVSGGISTTAAGGSAAAGAPGGVDFTSKSSRGS